MSTNSKTPAVMHASPAALTAIGDINAMLSQAFRTAMAVEDDRDRLQVLSHLSRVMSSTRHDGTPLVSQVFKAREGLFRRLTRPGTDNYLTVEQVGALVGMSKQAVGRVLNYETIKERERAATQAKREAAAWEASKAQYEQPATFAEAA